MMFSNHPEKFFPQTQISVVVFQEGLVKNPNHFTEKTFKGSVPSIIRSTLQYLTIPAHDGCGDFLATSEEKSSTKSSTILYMMKENPSATLPEIAKALQMSKGGVRKIVEKLKAEGKVRRIGPSNGGHWIVA